MAFSCMTTDIVTEYAFDRSSNFLSSKSFEPNFHDAIVSGSNLGPYTKQFPWLLPLMNMLPESVATKMAPEMAMLIKFQKDMRRQIGEIQAGHQEFTKPTRTEATIFHELLNGSLPDNEKRLERLWQEGQIIIGAGTETTAWTLSATMYYILANPEILSRLRGELEQAAPDPQKLPSLARLEQLPYLTAVVNEGLRLSYGVSTRLQRISRETLEFTSGSGSDGSGPGKTSFAIPAGTPVGMTATLIHLNEKLFPKPHRFDPDRWLDEKGQRSKQLEGYLLSFSKGSRQCVGINLAYAEVYLGLATLIRRLGDRFELWETDISDVEIQYDRFVPCPKLDTNGIQVLVK
jgi:cytochrome P450